MKQFIHSKLHTFSLGLGLIGLCQGRPQGDGVQTEDDFFATTLEGFDGCGGLFDPSRKAAIRAGWRDAWKVQDEILNGASWKEAVALEFLGAPSSLTKVYQDAIDGILKQVATLQKGYVWTPFDWPLHVRCDDPQQECSCGAGANTYAYTVNDNTDSSNSYINFCPRYFDAPLLADKIKDMKSAPDYEKLDINSYHGTKAHIWVHELMHWDKGARRDVSTHITDYCRKNHCTKNADTLVPA